MKLAAEKADYGTKLPRGKGRGLALHESFHTIVAMVVDVSVKGSTVKVDRVVAAMDCGIAVNPDVIKAQIESGVGFGLGAALRNKITLTDGVVDQANFDTYEPLRLSDMPAVDVHIVKSNQPPTGVGEPGVPPIAPAVSNAIFAATGKRLRSLPFDFGNRSPPPCQVGSMGAGSMEVWTPLRAFATASVMSAHGSSFRRRHVSTTLRMAA